MSYAQSAKVLCLALLTLSLSLLAAAERPLTVSPSDITAGEATVVSFTVRAPEGGIVPGGRIRFYSYLKPWDGLVEGLSDDFTTNTLVKAQRNDGGVIQVVNKLNGPDWPVLSDLDLLVEDTSLAPGASVTVTFGTEEQTVKNLRKQAVLIVEAGIDSNNDGDFDLLPAPKAQVSAGAPKHIYLAATSAVGVGEKAHLVAWAQDASGNVCDQYETALELSCKTNGVSLPATLQTRQRPADADLWRNETAITFEKPGAYVITVHDVERDLWTTSNVITVTAQKPSQRLYWGDLHIHTQLSDGKGELVDVYRDTYARGHDFIAITDHAFGRDARGTLRERLDEICSMAGRFNRPGKFATIPAGETHYLPTHMNLYFGEPDPEEMERVANGLSKDQYGHKMRDRNDKAKIQAGYDAYWGVLSPPENTVFPIVAPTHPMWLGHRELMNFERIRVVEVYNGMGQSEMRDQSDTAERYRLKRLTEPPEERFCVREVLDDGHRIGVIGGSDTHKGQAGEGALTGLRMSELSRNAVLSALHNRHSIGTTGARVNIEFSTTNANMGEMLVGHAQATFNYHVTARKGIDWIQIISNGEVVHSDDLDNVQSFTNRWQPADLKPGYYYVRVRLDDTQMACSSPIWVEKR